MFSKNKSVFYAYLIYFTSMILFTVVRIISSAGLFNNLHSDIKSIIFTLIIQGLIMALIPILLHALLNKKEGGIKYTFSSINLKPIKFNAVLISIALGVLAFFINIIISSVFNGFLNFFGYKFPTSSGGGESLFNPFVSFILDVLLVAVIPGICEEILHRGLLLNEIGKIGYKKAIIISSLLFGLIHFNITQFFYAFVIGLLLGLVTVATKTIVPAIIIHFTNNFLSVYFSAAKANGWFLGNFYEILNSFLQSQSALLTLLTSMLFIVFIGLGVIMLLLALFKETTLFNVNKALKDFMDEKLNSENELSINDKQAIINEMLIKKSNLNLNFSKEMSPFEIIMPVNKFIFKPTTYDNVFLTASLVLGSLVTFFTFIWGVL